MIAEIIRLEENFEFGTFGVLRVDKHVFCVTLELPDLLNKRSQSSIPAQQYLCRRVNSPKFGDTFEVTNVPGRSHILFHAGNVISDTEGCIILAEHFGKLGLNRGVLNSGKTFRVFMKMLLGIDTFHLTVHQFY